MWRETNCSIEVVNERPHISRISINDAGSCMGCPRYHRVVNVLRSATGSEIRLCNNCTKELKNAN